MPPILDKDTIAVILLNLGGPETLDDVRPFLYNLFSDRQIIRLGPSFMQKPIAWWIAKKRAPKSRNYYQQIGGGSPLNSITSKQCTKLEQALAGHGNFKVFMAMRYWKPYVSETLAQLKAHGTKKIIALTLYPHYSIATTGSSLTELLQSADTMDAEFTIKTIEYWPTEQHYIDCLSNRITKALNASDQATEVVYSAHSLPVKFINEGDPYVDHIKQTIQAIEAQTKTEGHLCFQSRSGPVEWLSPSTPEMIEDLARKGCKRMLIIPISFVSDHVETLYEIDIQYRKKIEALGIEFARIPSLNTDPHFIKGLAELVKDAASSWE